MYRKRKFGNDITNVRLFRSPVLSRTLTWTHMGYLGAIAEASYQVQTWSLSSLFKPNYSASDLAVPPDPTNTSVAQLGSGGSAQFVADKVILTSPKHPKDWYQDQGDDKIAQLLDRFKRHPESRIVHMNIRYKD